MRKPEFKVPTDVIDLIGRDQDGDEYRVTIRADREVTIRIFDGTFRRYLSSPQGGGAVAHLLLIGPLSVQGMMGDSGESLSRFFEGAWTRDVVPALERVMARRLCG